MSEHAIPVEWLTLYHDGELDEARRRQVEEHLLSCDSCQRELAALVSLSDALTVDRLSEGALVSQPVFWRELEPRLPKRQAAETSPLRWLPGIGLLVASGLAQFLVAASVVVMFVAGQFPSIAQPVDWLNRALAGWLLGGLAWLLPGQWSGWGLSLCLVALSAWLTVLYLVWLGYVWRHRPMSAVRLMTWKEGQNGSHEDSVPCVDNHQKLQSLVAVWIPVRPRWRCWWFRWWWR